MITKNKTLIATAIATASLATQPSFADSFNVTEAMDSGQATVEGSLSWAIRQANALAGADTISLQTDIIQTGISFALIDSDVTIEGNNYSLSGADEFRPLFIKSGTVVLKNLTVQDGLAQGAGSTKGGSGAGLGGGLFIYGGDVSIQDSAFKDNKAKGGSHTENITRYGGGGMQQTSVGARVNTLATSLFGNEQYGNNGVNASGNYGGSSVVNLNYENAIAGPGENGGFGGAGGQGFNLTGLGGGHGGFGGGGGQGYVGGGANGGFGAGGGYAFGVRNTVSDAGEGGFGAGGGSAKIRDEQASQGISGFGASSVAASSEVGGNGAGMGGAIFIRSGSLNITNTSFDDNSAVRGGSANVDPALEAKGYGGAIFVMHTVENTNGNNQAMPNVLPTVSGCEVTFGDLAVNAADSEFESKSTHNLFSASDLDLLSSCENDEPEPPVVPAEPPVEAAAPVEQVDTPEPVAEIESSSSGSSGGAFYWLLLLAPAWMKLRRQPKK